MTCVVMVMSGDGDVCGYLFVALRVCRCLRNTVLTGVVGEVVMGGG